MIEPTDERHPAEPLLLQRPVDALGDGDAPMLADGTETLLDAEWFEEVSDIGAGKAAVLVTDEVFRRTVNPERLHQGIRDAFRALADQGPYAHDLARKKGSIATMT